ncbi:MAG: potassium transporter TrkG [Candidatus Altiarchaeota archaeon]|nr:potassium transporter TrkG [Candidatus Altiarchaeota archaeon]
MDIRHIERYLGIFLLISGLLSLLPAIVAYHYGEPVIPHVLTAVLSCLCGLFFIKSPRHELDFGDAMLLVALALLITSFFGAIPFFMILKGDLLNNLVNGYFESVSGYTTTGFSILGDELNPDSGCYSHSIIFRRALTEWVGGLGVIVLFLSILAKGGISTVYLYKMEVGARKITPSVEHTAKIILRVYLFYTFIGVVLLWLLSEDLFHSITAIMSTISTGGFIFLDQGFNADFLSMSVLTLYMLIGAIPFTMHYTLFSGSWGKFFRNMEIRTLCVVIAISFLLFVTLLWDELYKYPIQYILPAVVSTVTTTGDIGVNLYSGDVGKFILITLTIVGAGAGSTCGGLKLVRFAVLMKAIQWLITKSSLPDTAVIPLKLGKRVFADKELRTISLFFFIYVILMVMGMLILLVSGVGSGGGSVKFVDALMLSASAQGNSSITNLDINSQPLIVRIFLIFQMIAGRLEIFPVLALIGYLIHSAKTEALILEHEAVEVEHKLIDDLEKVEHRVIDDLREVEYTMIDNIERDIEIVEGRIKRFRKKLRDAREGK